MAEDHGAPEAGQLPRVWTRDCRETESRQNAHRYNFTSFLDSHCPSAEEYSSLSACTECNQIVHSFPTCSTTTQAWWSPEVEEAVRERRKAFAATHRSDEGRQAYILSSRYAPPVIAKAKPSSIKLFVLSIMQEDVHTLRERSCSVCKSSVRLGHHDG